MTVQDVGEIADLSELKRCAAMLELQEEQVDAKLNQIINSGNAGNSLDGNVKLRDALNALDQVMRYGMY